MDESELFNAAVKLSAEEQAKFLDLACKGNPELRGQVEALIKAHFDSGVFLDESGNAAERDRLVDETRFDNGCENPGMVIAGRYKLIEEIGEGGMGSVWLAEQKEPVKRKVAIKLIKAGMDSKSVLARFDAERQALALMDHPNIAKVFDGGMTDQGRPFFVMEYVKGMPLTEYCDQARLSLKERLNLFTPVCQAVQHAHQKGIIHRDLKPSNILICLYDGKPVPKVIDFGLAKAMHQSLTDQSLHTAHGVMVGTPLYMSPEQAEHNNLDVDTRTDIYSLGVILYELLTGSTPLEKLQLKEAAFNEILRLIKEVEPQKPSTRLSSSASLPSIAAQRSIEPNQLKKSLIGDLDWIVMKALDKERSRRYETANGLARDVERFLNDEAVEACPASAAYKFRKYIRRNRGQVIAAATVLTVLLLGMAGTTGGMIWANRERALAEAEKSKATLAAVSEAEAKVAAQENEQKAISAAKQAEASKEQEAKARKRAETISEFVTTSLKASDAQNAGGGQDMTILAAMDNAIADIDSGRFKDDPETEAGLRDTIGVILRNNGKYDTAKPLLQQALAMRERLFKGDDPIVASSLNSLASLYQEHGQYAQAEPLFTRALAINEKALGSEHTNVAVNLHNLAVLYSAQGQYAQAEPLLTRSLAINEKTLTPDHPAVASCLLSLATLYSDQGQYAQAEPLYMRALAINEKALGPDHPEVAKSLNNLAALYQEQGQYAQAEPLFIRALAINEKTLGPDHPSVASCLSNLDNLYSAQGQFAQAEPLVTRALAIREKALGPDHPEVANSLNNLAAIYQEQGQYAQAEPLFTRALAINEKALGPNHTLVAANLHNLALLSSAQGRHAQAEPLFIRALAIIEKTLAPDHPHLLSSKLGLARVYWAQRKLDKSVPLFEEVLKAREAKLGRQHPDTLNTVGNLGWYYMDAGRLAEAIPLLEEAYRASKQYPTLRVFGEDLLDAYTKAVDPAKPESTARVVALMQELLAAVRVKLPKDSPELAGQLAAFSMTLLSIKAWDEAEPLIREALTIREKAQPDDWLTFNTKSMLGGALLGQKKFADAEPLLLTGYEGMKEREQSIPAQGAIRLPEALERLVELYSAWHMAESDKSYDVKAAEWQKKLDEFTADASAETAPTTDKAKQP